MHRPCVYVMPLWQQHSTAWLMACMLPVSLRTSVSGLSRVQKFLCLPPDDAFKLLPADLWIDDDGRESKRLYWSIIPTHSMRNIPTDCYDTRLMRTAVRADNTEDADDYIPYCTNSSSAAAKYIRLFFLSGA